MTRITPLALFILACTAIGGAPVAAGQPDAPSTRCDALLTAEEAVAVVGDGYQGPAVDEPRPGFTRCEWQGADSNFGFTFASLKALGADQTTADKEFDTARAIANP